MKRCIGGVLIVWAAMAIPAVSAAAEKDKPARQSYHGGAMTGRKRTGLAAELLKGVKLSEDLAAQVREKVDAYTQVKNNWLRTEGRKLGKMYQDLLAAGKAGDQDKATALRRDVYKIMAVRRTQQDNLLEQLGRILTKEQMIKVRANAGAMRAGPIDSFKTALAKVDLTKKQKAATEMIFAEVEKALSLGKKPRTVRTEAFKKIRGLLTPDQAKQLARAERQMRMKAAGFGILDGLGLSEKQKAAAESIFAEAEKAASQGKQRSAAFSEAFKKIQGLLTPDQAKQLARVQSQLRAKAVVLRVFGQLNLTEKQQEQITRFFREQHKFINEAEDPQVKRRLMGKMLQDAAEKFLTEEQRQQMQARRVRPRQGPPGGAGHRQSAPNTPG